MAFSIDPLRAGRLWLWFPVIDFTVTKLNFSQDKRKGRKGMKGWRTRGKKRKWQRGVQGKDRRTRENPFSFPWVCPHRLTFPKDEWIIMDEVKR